MTLAESADLRTHYSPDRRTALVLTGTGSDGAYHAGALRGLVEAGVRLDLVAGRGIGAAGALFAAIDGGARLWDAGGLWRQPALSWLYPWRMAYRRVGLGVAIAAILLVVPALVFALGAVIYQIALLADAGGPGRAAWLTETWGSLLREAFAPTGLPTRIPQLVAAVLAVLVVG